MKKRRTLRWPGRTWAGLIALLGILSAAACSNPVGLRDAQGPATHTTSSGNHTTSSGNLADSNR